MKKRVGIYFFLLLIVAGCKSKKEIQILRLTVNGSSVYPIKIYISNLFLSRNEFTFVDTTGSDLMYRLAPGQIVSINDTSFRVFSSDTIIIDEQLGKLTLRSVNYENIKYNRLFKELLDTLAPIYQRETLFFQGKEDTIVNDKNYIDDYLSKSDKAISVCVEDILHKYQFSRKDKDEIKSSILQTGRLSRSFFYFTGCIGKLDSLNTLQERLLCYRDKIDSQHVSIFSQNEISLLSNKIAYYLLNKSINAMKTQDDIEHYYLSLQPLFKKKSVSYNFLIASILAKAQSSNIKFNIPRLQSEVRKSPLYKYICRNRNISVDQYTQDKSLDSGLYDAQFKPIEIKTIVARYKGTPLLIDFWATWCSPCLKKIPNVVDYKKIYPKLNIVFVSLDKSNDMWKSFLYDNKSLSGFPQYRKNAYYQDSLFNQITEIPKYGFLYGNGRIELVNELTDSSVSKYMKNF